MKENYNNGMASKHNTLLEVLDDIWISWSGLQEYPVMQAVHILILQMKVDSVSAVVLYLRQIMLHSEWSIIMG
jgi:hypothetical protein